MTKRILRGATPEDEAVYSRRVRALEEEGLCTSDAQAAADVERDYGKGPWAPSRKAPRPATDMQHNVIYHGPDMQLWGKVGSAARAQGFSDPESPEYEAYIFVATVDGEEIAIYCAHDNLHAV